MSIIASSFRWRQERKISGINSIIETGTANMNHLASNTVHDN
jgi:hypothetical protein